MTLAMNLPRCGSSLSIYRYDGDGVLFPTTALLKDEDGQYWKFEFNCPAELSDIPPDDFKEQREKLSSRNERQKRLEKDQEQDDSSFSSTNGLMKNEKPWGETRQQNFEGNSSSSTWMQNEKRTIATKQRSPGTKPPATEPRHIAQTRSWQWEPWYDERRIVPQAYGSAWEAQKARKARGWDTWRDKWSRADTVAWMMGRRTAQVRLPRCGSTVSIHKYVGDGVLFPTIAWLRDENDQYWMVALQRPAELTELPPDECKQQPAEEVASKNSEQQQLENDQDQKRAPPVQP